MLCAWPILRDRYIAREAREREEVNALAWEKNARMEDLIKSGEVVPGMTLEQVRRSKGEPSTKGGTADASKQQWVYRHQTVFFENGVVTSIETNPR